MRNVLGVLVLMALAAVRSFAADAASMNWLVNGDFRSQGGWNNSPTLVDGPEGFPAAFLENKSPMWTEFSQRVDLPQPLPPALEVSGWLKTENVVKGPNDWEVARITIVFYDANGKRAGDWPAPIANVQGTHDWEYYSNQFTPPPGTAWVTTEISLGNCTGKAWFSRLALTVYDYDQKPLAPGQPTHPDRKAPSDVRSDNWLLNPGFEMPGGGDWGQARIGSPGHDSIHCLVESNDSPAWTLASQNVSFKDKHPVFVVYSGWVKTKGVTVGANNWETARLGIDFRDDQNKQVGGWQDSVCKVVGDSDWAYYEKKYAVPTGATQAQVDAGLGNCVGKGWFDDLALKLLDADGKAITTLLVTEQRSDTSDWYAYTPPKDPADAPLDLSFLNDRPAGKHGFVTVKDGHFTFADGTRVRFWGSDLVGPNNFPTHAQADALAVRLSKLGVNLMRFHMPEASWSPDNNFFDPKADNTLTLKPEQVEKFDYLLAALKKNGIYFYPDWLVDRKFKEGDGVMAWQDLGAGAKGVIHFDPKVIELTKKYAQELIGHVNPYTGLALKDDPAYVGNEIANESSIFSGFGAQDFPEPYWDELQKMYSAAGGPGAITRFKFDWETQKLVPVKDPENADATLKFLLAQVTRADRDMKEFQAGLSPHALLTGSNMGLPVLGSIRSDATLDFMDTHAYWDHPQIWNIAGGWQNVAHAPMNNTSQLLSPFQGSLVFGLSNDAVEDKPLIVTEWNDCFPNEYRLEGPMLMAAYGSLQDWDGMLQFDHGIDVPGTVRMTNFDINNRVDDQPLFQAGALIFRLGYLKASPVTVVEPLSDKDVLSNGMKSDWLFDHPWLPYVARVVKKFTGKGEGKPADIASIEKLYDASGKRVDSVTGEESLDFDKGILKIDSPKAQGLVGNIGVEQVLGTSGFTMKLAKRNPFAAVVALSLDRQPLDRSKTFIVIAQARAENSGQVYNPTRTALKEAGGPPILQQGVEGALSIRVGASARFAVYPLDESGHRKAAVPAKVEKGALKFSISPKDHTSYYWVTAVDKK
ncbi:MAG TPA: hypothetical protein VHE12_11310 [bacterium]|nr:hypothetical protein [bacterium]